MKLYIQIKNGQPFEHPILEKNFCEAFPDVDTNNLPPEFAVFQRVKCPQLGIYQVMIQEDSTYELVDGIYKDVWHIRDMTAEEKSAIQQATITAFNSREQAENWSAWTIDEATCQMIPPIPRPDPVDGLDVMWCGAENNWKQVPQHPIDDNQYKFDFFAWQWVQIVN